MDPIVLIFPLEKLNLQDCMCSSTRLQSSVDNVDKFLQTYPHFPHLFQQLFFKYIFLLGILLPIP